MNLNYKKTQSNKKKENWEQPNNIFFGVLHTLQILSSGLCLFVLNEKKHFTPKHPKKIDTSMHKINVGSSMYYIV